MHHHRRRRSYPPRAAGIPPRFGRRCARRAAMSLGGSVLPSPTPPIPHELRFPGVGLGVGHGLRVVDPPDLEQLRGVFEAQPVSRLVVLKPVPGDWWPGGWYGLDLPDCPGTREERAQYSCTGMGAVRHGQKPQVRRQPAAPLVPEGAEPGRRFWWCPGWLELPMRDVIPRDAWFFPRNPKLRTPDIWFVPHWSESKQPGEDDPDFVQMLWRDGHIAERPGHKGGPSGKGERGRRCGKLRVPRYILYNVQVEWGVLGLAGF